jgi:hypothetical protein
VDGREILTLIKEIKSEVSTNTAKIYKKLQDHDKIMQTFKGKMNNIEEKVT